MTPYVAFSALSTATTGMNEPLPRRTYVAPYLPAGPVNRHLGMWCGCPLLDCCHHEMPEDGYAFRHGREGRHVDSGSPQSGYLHPWEPGDESWRGGPPIPELARAPQGGAGQ